MSTVAQHRNDLRNIAIMMPRFQRPILVPEGLIKLEDLGHERDQYVVTALVHEEMLDTIIEKCAGRPRWVR